MAVSYPASTFKYAAGLVAALTVLACGMGHGLAQAGAGVVAAVVEERGATEAFGEFPIGPGPGPAMVCGPPDLAVAHITRQQIQDLIHTKDPGSLFATETVAAGRPS